MSRWTDAFLVALHVDFTTTLFYRLNPLAGRMESEPPRWVASMSRREMVGLPFPLYLMFLAARVRTNRFSYDVKSSGFIELEGSPVLLVNTCGQWIANGFDVIEQASADTLALTWWADKQRSHVIRAFALAQNDKAIDVTICLMHVAMRSWQDFGGHHGMIGVPEVG